VLLDEGCDEWSPENADSAFQEQVRWSTSRCLLRSNTVDGVYVARCPELWRGNHSSCTEWLLSLVDKSLTEIGCTDALTSSPSVQSPYRCRLALLSCVLSQQIWHGRLALDLSSDDDRLSNFDREISCVPIGWGHRKSCEDSSDFDNSTTQPSGATSKQWIEAFIARHCAFLKRIQ
jgi:hypothetical protein